MPGVTPLAELTQRVARLQKKMRQKLMDGILLTENMNLFYFAGSMQQGFLFIPAEGEPVYMVRRSLARAVQESSWEQVLPLQSLTQLPLYLHKYAGKDLKKIGLEFDVLPVNRYQRLRRVLPDIDFKEASLLPREVRMVKSVYEIKLLRKAAEMTDNVFQKIPGLLEIGKPEVVLAAELESLYRKEGHQGVVRMRAFNMEMFFGHLLFGENGALVSFLDSPTGGTGLTAASPQSAGWKPLAPHEPVVVDYGGNYGGYCIDQARIFSLGRLSSTFNRAFALAQKIQEEVILKAVPGASCAKLYELAVEVAAAHGLGDYFMGFGDDQVKYIGHGMGLDFDEFPLFSWGSKHILAPGMVFALEPKFLFPGKGMVGLENTWHVTEKGTEKLSITPDELLSV